MNCVEYITKDEVVTIPLHTIHGVYFNPKQEELVVVKPQQWAGESYRYYFRAGPMNRVYPLNREQYNRLLLFIAGAIIANTLTILWDPESQTAGDDE